MLVNRSREVVLPFLIAILTTLLTVGTLSLLLQTSVKDASNAKTPYVQ